MASTKRVRAEQTGDSGTERGVTFADPIATFEGEQHQEDEEQQNTPPKLSGDPNEVTVIATLDFQLCVKGDGTVGYKVAGNLASPTQSIDADYDGSDNPNLEVRGVFPSHFCYQTIETTCNAALRTFVEQAIDAVMHRTGKIHHTDDHCSCSSSSKSRKS